MTLISVLVPVLNEEHRIAETLASILAQPGADLEVLVADGRSADETAAVVARIAATDRRVRLLDNPKRDDPGRPQRRARRGREGASSWPGSTRTRTSTADYLVRGGSGALRDDPEVAAIGGDFGGASGGNAAGPCDRAGALVSLRRGEFF